MSSIYSRYLLLLLLLLMLLFLLFCSCFLLMFLVRVFCSFFRRREIVESESSCNKPADKTGEEIELSIPVVDGKKSQTPSPPTADKIY